MSRHSGFTFSSVLALAGAAAFAMAVTTTGHARSLPRSEGVMDRGSAFSIPNEEQGTSRLAAEPLATPDRHFLTQALRNSEKEVAILRLATQRAEDPQLRKMAQRLIAHREQATEELRRLARGYSLPLPEETPAERSGSAELYSLSGGRFDRAWLEQVIATQRRTLDLFERSANSSRDGRIRTFAQSNLPTLQKTLSLLKSALPPDGRLAQVKF